MPYLCTYPTPEGFSDILMQSDGAVLTGLWFATSRDAARHGTPGEPKELSIFRETTHWLNVYFSGQAPDFTPPYKIANLTPFRRQVIDILNTIPFGETCTYNEIAKWIAKENGIERMSAQAVGGAVGWNPICILIPCHRVVGAHGNLTGYGGGLPNKIALLAHEKNDMSRFTLPKQRYT